MISSLSMRRVLAGGLAATLGSCKISWRRGGSLSATNSSDDMWANLVTRSSLTDSALSDTIR